MDQRDSLLTVPKQVVGTHEPREREELLGTYQALQLSLAALGILGSLASSCKEVEVPTLLLELAGLGVAVSTLELHFLNDLELLNRFGFILVSALFLQLGVEVELGRLVLGV
jgi:hypothetical protein